MGEFQREPDGWTDEDGDRGYVNVTAATATAEAARQWLLGPGAASVLNLDDRYRRVRPEGLELRHLSVELPPANNLPTALEVGCLVRSGVATAWWTFDISMATEEITDRDWEAESARLRSEREAVARRHAVEWRGPWWWRLRCWAAQVAIGLGTRLEPRDRSSVSWVETDPRALVIQQVRLPHDQGDRHA
jgi:hypothetical protein